MARRRALLAGITGLATAAALVGAAVAASPAAAASTCQTTSGTASGVPYTATICIDSPESGTTITGTTDVTASATVTPAGLIDRMVFWWGPLAGSPVTLLADHDAPYRMVFDTTHFPNGPNTLSIRPVFVGGAVTPRLGIPVTIDNPSPPPPDGETFEPWTGGPKEPGERVRMAVVGDGVDGSPESHAVTSVIEAAEPDVFAYLGDVYDRGTYAEFDTWYSDPDSYGRLLDITNPAVGNHEYMQYPNAEPYFEFWDEVPHYYSYDVGGWHVIVIDSTTEFAQLGVNSAQFKWFAADLAANKDRCTMFQAHHARWTAVSGVNRIAMQAMWEQLVDQGADLILAGHAHTYERWTPLDRSGLVPTTEGITQFVVGTGGRPILNVKVPEPRVVTQVTTPGALFLDLGATDANFTFTSANGTYSDSGTITCRTPPDVTRTDTSVLPGENGWDRGDVTATWQVSDPESPVTTVGCEPVAVTADQPKTTYTCTATSGGGVTVDEVEIGRDATPPSVAAAADPAEPDGTNDWYVSQPTVSFTCSDLTSKVASCPDPVQPAEGSSSVTRAGSDNAGNTTEVTFGPVKVDLTDPVVTCDPKPTYLLHQTGTLVGAKVADEVSGPLRAVEIVPVGTTTVGDQTVPITGTDLAGRTSTTPCAFRVVYGFSGWLPPVNGSTTNVVKAGKVVPLKWRLTDAAGLPVTGVTGATVSTVSCSGTGGPVTESAVGGSGLQDLGDGYYQFNWRPRSSYVGTCRTVQLDLGDDLLRTVSFQITT